MYSQLKSRFITLEYKTLTRKHGELIESEETYTFKGYISYSFEHLINSGVDIKDAKATVITTPTEIIEALKYDGISILVDANFNKVRNVIPYRDPFTSNVGTYELVI